MGDLSRITDNKSSSPEAEADSKHEVNVDFSRIITFVSAAAAVGFGFFNIIAGLFDTSSSERSISGFWQVSLGISIIGISLRD